MIETGYFAQMKNYPDSDVLVCVAIKYPWFIKRLEMVWLSELAPSQDLLDDWKQKEITWDSYTERFIKEMEHPLKQKAIRSLRRDAITYRLICWEKNPPCHRFILKDLILRYEGKTE